MATNDDILAKLKARFTAVKAEANLLKAERKKLRKFFRGKQWTRKQVKRLKALDAHTDGKQIGDSVRIVMPNRLTARE